jgi:hypothetical protein
MVVVVDVVDVIVEEVVPPHASFPNFRYASTIAFIASAVSGQDAELTVRAWPKQDIAPASRSLKNNSASVARLLARLGHETTLLTGSELTTT